MGGSATKENPISSPTARLITLLHLLAHAIFIAQKQFGPSMGHPIFLPLHYHRHYENIAGYPALTIANAAGHLFLE